MVWEKLVSQFTSFPSLVIRNISILCVTCQENMTCQENITCQKSFPHSWLPWETAGDILCKTGIDNLTEEWCRHVL